MEMKNILHRMLSHEEFTRKETHDILVGITRSEFPAEQITALLTGLQMRGITVDELLGLRDGILETGVPVVLDCDRYTDIVGTGGDGKNTFNISTCACFVMAGAGYKVAKHGNYAATSASGASNVIEAHGVEFTADSDRLNRSMDGCGVVYLHAPPLCACHEVRCSGAPRAVFPHMLQPAWTACQSFAPRMSVAGRCKSCPDASLRRCLWQA